MSIKIYKHKETGEEIRVTNENIINKETKEVFVLYKTRKDSGTYIMPIKEIENYTLVMNI